MNKMSRKKFDYKSLGYLGMITQIALIMIIPIFAGVIVGNMIDKWAGTNGIFLIVFILMGIYMAFRNLFVTVLRKIDKGKKDPK